MSDEKNEKHVGYTIFQNGRGEGFYSFHLWEFFSKCLMMPFFYFNGILL